MKEMMKACAVVAPGKLQLVEVPVPEPDDYEVLVKNEGCVFCNTTDRLITDHLFATPAYPILLGHEDFGKVVKVGKKVTKYKLGDRVICLGRRQQRLEIAQKLGADRCFIDTREAADHIRANGGADVILEASGNYKATEQGFPYLKEGGIFAVYAMPSQPYVFDIRSGPRDFRIMRIDPVVTESLEDVCNALRVDFPVEVFLTHQWEMDQVVEAFEEVRRGEVIKGLVRFE